VKGAVEVDVDDGLPGVLRELFERRLEAPAGVVHVHAVVAERLDDGLADAL
jgi:hypothetical protein